MVQATGPEPTPWVFLGGLESEKPQWALGRFWGVSCSEQPESNKDSLFQSHVGSRPHRALPFCHAFVQTLLQTFVQYYLKQMMFGCLRPKERKVKPRARVNMNHPIGEAFGISHEHEELCPPVLACLGCRAGYSACDTFLRGVIPAASICSHTFL